MYTLSIILRDWSIMVHLCIFYLCYWGIEVLLSIYVYFICALAGLKYYGPSTYIYFIFSIEVLWYIYVYFIFSIEVLWYIYVYFIFAIWVLWSIYVYFICALAGLRYYGPSTYKYFIFSIEVLWSIYVYFILAIAGLKNKSLKLV